MLDPFGSVAATDPIAGCLNVLLYRADVNAFKLLCINRLYPNMHYQRRVNKSQAFWSCFTIDLRSKVEGEGITVIPYTWIRLVAMNF